MNTISFDIQEPESLELEVVEAKIKPEEEVRIVPSYEEQTVLPKPGMVIGKAVVEPIPDPTDIKDIFTNGDHDVRRYGTVRVTVPQGVFPSGTAELTTNNSTEDVTQYQYAHVAVAMPEEYAIGGSLVDKTLTGYHYPSTSTATSLTAEFFRGCSYLRTIDNFPQSVTAVPNGYAHGCSELQSVNLPDGITSIGQNAFYDCRKLNLSKMPTQLTSLGGSCFQGCYGLEQIILPSGVTNIFTYSFMNCRGLKVFEAKGDVTTIGIWAFRYAGNNVPQTIFIFCECTAVPSLANASVFEGIKANSRIVVPDALVSSWKAAQYWSAYANYIIGASDYDAQS